MDKIFTWVWRINGLLFMFGALLLAGSLIFNQINRRTQIPHERTVTNIASDPEGKEKWFLASPRRIKGTDMVYLELVSENSEVLVDDSTMNYFGDGHSYTRDKSKNILFLNEVTDKSHWLFNGVEQLIMSVKELPEHSRYGSYNSAHQDEKTVVIVYSVIDSDTNKDGAIDAEDQDSLALSNALGSNYRVVLEDYERVLSVSLIEENILSIIYQTEGAIYSLKYAIDNSKLLSNTALPTIE